MDRCLWILLELLERTGRRKKEPNNGRGRDCSLMLMVLCLSGSLRVLRQRPSPSAKCSRLTPRRHMPYVDTAPCISCTTAPCRIALFVVPRRPCALKLARLRCTGCADCFHASPVNGASPFVHSSAHGVGTFRLFQRRGWPSLTHVRPG